jgi:hypothetical protein
VSTCSLVQGMAAVGTPATAEEAQERNPRPHPGIPRRSPDRYPGSGMAAPDLAAVDTAAVALVGRMVAGSAQDKQERRLAAAPEPRRSGQLERSDFHLPGQQRRYR